MTTQPTLVQLAEFLRLKKAEKSALTKAYEEQEKALKEIIEGIEELIADTFPEGVDTQSVTLPDGAKASITKKQTSQFRILEGQSEIFYDWVTSNGRADLLQRRLKQDAMEAEVIANGLPPGAFVHAETAIGMTVRRAAPSVS